MPSQSKFEIVDYEPEDEAPPGDESYLFLCNCTGEGEEEE